MGTTIFTAAVLLMVANIAYQRRRERAEATAMKGVA
jgi:hypothetical protein